MDRRTFLTNSIAAGAVVGSTALSYSRVIGANDRISLGHIGIRNRGGELDWIPCPPAQLCEGQGQEERIREVPLGLRLCP